MPFLIITVLFLSTMSFAKIKDCYKEVSQAEKNECMLFERDQAVGRLMSAVTEYCAAENGVKDSLGGSIYPMLLDECMTRQLDHLSKDLKSKN